MPGVGCLLSTHAFVQECWLALFCNLYKKQKNWCKIKFMGVDTRDTRLCEVEEYM